MRLFRLLWSGGSTPLPCTAGCQRMISAGAAQRSTRWYLAVPSSTFDGPHRLTSLAFEACVCMLVCAALLLACLCLHVWAAMQGY